MVLKSFKIYIYISQKSVIRVWNNMRMSKRWQNSILGWTIPVIKTRWWSLNKMMKQTFAWNLLLVIVIIYSCKWRKWFTIVNSSHLATKWSFSFCISRLCSGVKSPSPVSGPNTRAYSIRLSPADSPLTGLTVWIKKQITIADPAHHKHLKKTRRRK